VANPTTVRRALCWGSFAWFSLGVSPDIFWLDSGELVAATAELGVIHPPGTPGYTLLARALAPLPLGTIAFRVAMASAVCMSLALASCLAIIQRRGANAWICAGTAAWIVLGATVLRSARVAEIYGLASCLGLAFVSSVDWALRSPSDLRPRLLAIFVGAWGGVCFGDLRVLVTVALILLAVKEWPRARAWLRWAPLVGCAGLLTVLSIPLSSVRGPSRDWGNPETFGALVEHLQARTIVEAYADRILPSSLTLWQVGLEATVANLTEDLGAFGLVFAIMALLTWALAREDKDALLLVALVVSVELVYSAGVNPMGIADRQTGMVLCLVLITATAVEITRLSRQRGRVMLALGPLAALAVLLPLALRAPHERRVTTSWMPHTWARGALAQTGSRGLLMAQSDDLIAGVLAAQVVEGARPDVLMVVGHHLHKGPSDQVRPEHEAFWRAVAEAPTSERAKVVAGWNRWRGPRSAERPGSGSLGGLDARAPVAIPVWSEAITPPPVEVQLSRWLPFATSAYDRQRLARGVNGGVAASLRKERGSSQALARAEAMYRLVLDRVDPDNVPAMVSLAAVLDRLGRTQSAINLCQRALELRPYHATAQRNLGVFIAKLAGVNSQALDAVLFAARLEPWDARNWRTMRAMCTQVGDEECEQTAREQLERLGETP
jgi:tetratricopeptide (TPR) repeat protein